MKQGTELGIGAEGDGVPASETAGETVRGQAQRPLGVARSLVLVCGERAAPTWVRRCTSCVLGLRPARDYGVALPSRMDVSRRPSFSARSDVVGVG
jgi:hypothetical protein